jgi:hypothetical protein
VSRESVYIFSKLNNDNICAEKCAGTLAISSAFILWFHTQNGTLRGKFETIYHHNDNMSFLLHHADVYELVQVCKA